MGKPESNLGFKLMAFSYKFRDFLQPRMNILKEVSIERGSHVLDYGCGPGSYVLPLAELVGQSGRIYALDIHSLALQMAERIVSRNQLTHVETICSDCETGLPDGSVDVILLYDTFHKLSEPQRVLEELHRVLKPNGVLSFSDHHMKEAQIKAALTEAGWFRLDRKGQRTYGFAKAG